MTHSLMQLALQFWCPRVILMRLKRMSPNSQISMLSVIIMILWEGISLDATILRNSRLDLPLRGMEDCHRWERSCSKSMKDVTNSSAKFHLDPQDCLIQLVRALTRPSTSSKIVTTHLIHRDLNLNRAPLRGRREQRPKPEAQGPLDYRISLLNLLIRCRFHHDLFKTLNISTWKMTSNVKS